MTTESTPESTAKPSCCGATCCGGRWMLIVLLALVLGGIILMRLNRPSDSEVVPPQVSPPQTADQSPVSGQAVSLTIQFADGSERQFDAVAWREGMTVDDLMTDISRKRDGIAYAMRGDGEMALLTRIDTTQNEGVRGKNWTYTVNGVRADRSFAVYPLRPGDHVLWTFAAAE